MNYLDLQMIDPIDPVKVYQKGSAEIKCKQPLGNPPAALSWQKNGTVITKTARIDPTDWTLKINYVQDSDNGTYTCIASNKAKTRMATARLVVVSKY